MSQPFKNGHFAVPPCNISVLKVPIKFYHFRREYCKLFVNASRFLINFGPWFSSDPLQALNHVGDPFISRALLLGVVSTESYLDLNAHQVQYGFEEDQRNKILRQDGLLLGDVSTNVLINITIVAFEVRSCLNIIYTVCSRLYDDVSVSIQRTFFRASNLLTEILT